MTRKAKESGPDRIKRLVREQGHTYQSLADEIGVSRQAIWAIIHGSASGATGRYALAAALGVEVVDLWPGAARLPEAA